MNKPAFNLIEEKWIPIIEDNPASLRDIFTQAHLRALGGNPRQKIALLKLLLAIAQAAATPDTDEDWASLGPDGRAEACLRYLDKWHDKFYLYGDRPFLQMPVAGAKKYPIGILEPEIATGNNPRLTHLECDRHWSDAEKAVILVTAMSMCLGGKTSDNTFSLADDYVKRDAQPGPGLGRHGLLHTFLTGPNLQQTIWLNLLSADNIPRMTWLEGGLGAPPWEKMPQSETCSAAQDLLRTLQGRLVPLARFCLFAGDSVHLTEGVICKTYKEGAWDASVGARHTGKEYKMLWADPEKRPWRSLSSLLAFLSATSPKGAFQCAQLEVGYPRLQLAHIRQFGIWSGGVKVSVTSSTQLLRGNDDMVESEVVLDREVMQNVQWFPRFSIQMEKLEKLAAILKSCVEKYFDSLGAKKTTHASKAVGMYWELAEKRFTEILDACAEPDKLPALERGLWKVILDCYDEVCGRASPRQLGAWAKNRPVSRLKAGTGPAKKATNKIAAERLQEQTAKAPPPPETGEAVRGKERAQGRQSCTKKKRAEADRPTLWD